MPVLEPDAHTLEVPAEATATELGAVSFARDIALWLGRIFDRPVERIIYRENPADRRPCPRARSYEIHIDGHVILITAYDRTPGRGDTSCTAHAISVDGHAVDDAGRPGRHAAWQLAWTAWRAAG